MYIYNLLNSGVYVSVAYSKTPLVSTILVRQPSDSYFVFVEFQK